MKYQVGNVVCTHLSGEKRPCLFRIDKITESQSYECKRWTKANRPHYSSLGYRFTIREEDIIERVEVPQRG